jgi:hypothetical protein
MRLLSITQRFIVALNEICISGKRGRDVEAGNEITAKKGRYEAEISGDIELVVKELPNKRSGVLEIGLNPEYWCQYMCGPDPRVWAAEDIQRAWRLRRKRRLQNSLEYLNFDGLKLS